MDAKDIKTFKIVDKEEESGIWTDIKYRYIEWKCTSRIVSAYHWLMNRFWYKWNIVRIRTLDEQWHDKDDVLLHAMFQILVDFVEGEEPDKNLNWDTDEESRRVWKEILFLYTWWTQTYPNRKDPAKSLKLVEENGNLMIEAEDEELAECIKFDNFCDKEDEEMMIRLIKIRCYLWT